MSKQKIHIQQLESRIKVLKPALDANMPSEGWIATLRAALGITLEQLAKRTKMSKQSLNALENREKSGSVSISTLKHVAEALDMELVYGFVPKDGSLDALVDRKARELATQIVMRTSNTMKLEDQENSKKRIEKAIKERTASIKNEMPKILWD